MYIVYLWTYYSDQPDCCAVVGTFRSKIAAASFAASIQEEDGWVQVAQIPIPGETVTSEERWQKYPL